VSAESGLVTMAVAVSRSGTRITVIVT